MTQPTLFDDAQQRTKKRVNVPRTSVEAGLAVNRNSRVALVLEELRFFESAECCPNQCGTRQMAWIRRCQHGQALTDTPWPV